MVVLGVVHKTKSSLIDHKFSSKQFLHVFSIHHIRCFGKDNYDSDFGEHPLKYPNAQNGLL